MLYIFSDSGGRMALVDRAAAGTKTRGTFSVAGSGKSWAHPVVIDGRLFLRYNTNLYCYDVRARQADGVVGGPIRR
jgi:hypothetical protein